MREFKVVIMGGGGVGKSAITVRFVHSLFVEKYDPTIEDSYRKMMTVDDVHCSCDIMDTAGTEQFMALHSLYMKSGDGFVLVFSLTSLDSLNELQTIRDQIERLKEADTVKKTPIVLVGNKCDLTHEREVPRDVAVALSVSWGGVPYYETSARKGINITHVFEDIVRQMINNGVGLEAKPTDLRKTRRKCTVL